MGGWVRGMQLAGLRHSTRCLSEDMRPNLAASTLTIHQHIHSMDIILPPASMPGISLTAVGARRGLLGVPGLEEDVGLVGVHLPGGKFIELTPWTGEVEWSAAPWGRWWVKARGQGYEAVVEATCEEGAGAVLRWVVGLGVGGLGWGCVGLLAIRRLRTPN